MGKHSGGDGDTMKSGGNWKGDQNRKPETKPLPKQEDKAKEKGPEHKDILRRGD